MNCANASVHGFEIVPPSDATLHGTNCHELSERELDGVAGGMLPLMAVAAAAAEGVIYGLAIVGAVAVGVAGTALVYKAATGKNLF